MYNIILSNLYFIIMIIIILFLGLALMQKDNNIQYLFYPKFKIVSSYNINICNFTLHSNSVLCICSSKLGIKEM